MARKSKTDKSAADPVSSQALAPLISNPEVFRFCAGWQFQWTFRLLHLAKGTYIPEGDLSLWDRCQTCLKIIAGMIWDWHRQHRISIPKEVFARVEFLFRQCGSDGYPGSAENRREPRGSPFFCYDRPTVFDVLFKRRSLHAPLFVLDVFSPDKKSTGDFGVMSRLLQETAADLCSMTGDEALVRLGASMYSLLSNRLYKACGTALHKCLRELRNRRLLPEGHITRLEDVLEAEARRPDTESSDEDLVQDIFRRIPDLMCKHAHVTSLESYRDFDWAHFREYLAPESGISAMENDRKALGCVDNRLARRDEAVRVAEDNVAAKEPAGRGRAPDDRYAWARQAELVRATNQVIGEDELNKGVLSRACTNGSVETNGKPGRASLVKVSSFLAWVGPRGKLTTAEVTQVRNAIIGEINARKPGRN